METTLQNIKAVKISNYNKAGQALYEIFVDDKTTNLSYRAVDENSAILIYQTLNKKSI